MSFRRATIKDYDPTKACDRVHVWWDEGDTISEWIELEEKIEIERYMENNLKTTKKAIEEHKNDRKELDGDNDDHGVHKFKYIYDVPLPQKPHKTWKTPKWIMDWRKSGL